MAEVDFNDYHGEDVEDELNFIDGELLNSETKTAADLKQLEKMLTQNSDYTLPFALNNDDQQEEENQQPTLTLPLLEPNDCKCAGTELVIDGSLPFEKQVAICDACHDVPYKMEWGVKPPLHTVYKKNLTSEQGHPQIIVSKKNSAQQPFDHIVVTAELLNTKDMEILSNELQGRAEESKIYHEVGETTKFEFKKLKIMMTSQQNKGANFQLLFKLIGQQNSQRFPLGCLISSPMQVYSHKNLLPENRHPPEIHEIIPDVLPLKGGKLCIICSNIQDSNNLKVKIGDMIIQKIPRKNAPVNATGIKVYQSTLVVDIPPQKSGEKVYVTVSNKDDKWSREKKNFTIFFRDIANSGSGPSTGPSLASLLKTLEEAVKPLYDKMEIDEEVDFENIMECDNENVHENEDCEEDIQEADENCDDDNDEDDIGVNSPIPQFNFTHLPNTTSRNNTPKPSLKTDKVNKSSPIPASCGSDSGSTGGSDEAKRQRKLERQAKRERKLKRQMEEKSSKDNFSEVSSKKLKVDN